jgi:hypothetical protein
MKIERGRGIMPKTNIEAVERYMIHADITLTDEQRELMTRIQHADEKKRARIYDREEIIKSIVVRFGVSRWRAEQDITDAHRLFGATRKVNKNYLLAQHLDNIEKQIKTFEKAHQYNLIPKLNDNYTYALNSLQQDAIEHDPSPTTIIFVVKSPNDSKRKSIEELLAEAEEKLKAEPEENEYLEFEEA